MRERGGPSHALGDEAIVGERVVGQTGNGRESVSHRGYCATDSDRPDLLHHGDADLGDGLEDFSVNVRAATPPTFVQEALVRAVATWAAYPNPAPAISAIAGRWGLPEEMVLPTSGAAEAFTLVARALRPRKAVVVHPQFTEPEAALRRAGHHVSRVLLERPFELNASDVPDDADLVVVGNPTNPTGVLHPVDVLRRLTRPGRVVLVDEAFLDEVGDDHSLIAPAMPGLLVTRSLTKAFSIAGVRAGYAVGSPDLIARLRGEQTPWSVSSPAITLMQACTSDEALAFVCAEAATIPAARDDLVQRLKALGLWVAPSQSPFVLVDTSSMGAGSLREPLAARGFAVRRCETFPGLGPSWLRLAVRTPRTHERLAAAFAAVQADGDQL
ncbi:Rv2231c family pyridoxal phosphate-dependent protein CobC [uncultured Tessaracoccus sp.]|uniref:Rv2231c family pyridoxal phosphate-dependent protein CobC n=1 Tax=uncultured Tessaracoccus sp. TaxID=905023 RepID=UPI0026234748|nr:Rv2231c family pyridoxal phosphate-dependent protein CobC [uncultured Tessaracoccus sp.]